MTYLNSGAPLFDGILFNNGEQLLIIVKDSLTQENWVVLTDDIGNSQTLLLQGTTSNDHNCFLKFSINGNTLRIQGDLQGDNTSLSSALELEFTPEEPNKIWLTCDRDSGAICIRSKLLYSGAIAFGFLERFDDSDSDAWMISKLNNRLLDAYVAKSKHDGTIWKQIGADFAEADNFVSTNLNGAYQGIFDFVTVPNPYISFLNTNLRNAGYSAHLGQIDGATEKPIITRRFYLEGRGAIDNYPGQLYNRGFVKHVNNGFGKIPQGKIVEDTDGSRYLSTGPDGWQGLNISNSYSVASNTPTIFRKGINFSLGINGLAEIRNTLINLDWTIVTEDSTKVLVKSSNGCYLKMESTNNLTISFQGDLAGDETKLSPALTLPYQEEGLNKIWITANSEALAVTIKNAADSSYQGLWFGFLKDSERWGLGYIKDDLGSTYILKNNVWQILSASFSNGAIGHGEATSPSLAPNSSDSFSSFPTTTSDRLTVAATPIRYYDYEDDRNSAYQAYKGGVNGATGKAQLDFYALIEGKSSSIAYGISDGENNAPLISYLGALQFCCVGMASLSPGAIVTLPSGAQYISCGGEGWQGMRIK